MKLTYREVKQRLEAAKKERLLEIIDNFNKKEETLKFACKLIFGKTDVENMKLASLKEAFQKMKIDFKEDKDVTKLLEKASEAVNDYQKQLWNHQKQEGKEQITYQSYLDDEVSRSLEEYSEKVILEEKNKQHVIALEKKQAEYIKNLQRFAQDIKDFEDRVQSYFQKAETMQVLRRKGICKHLQEEFTRYQSRYSELRKDSKKIIEEIHSLKQDTVSFQKELEKSQNTIEYEFPRIEHLLEGLAAIKNTSNENKEERETSHTKKALQDALDRYEIKMGMIEKYLKDLDKYLGEYSNLSSLEDVKVIERNMEKPFQELEIRFQTIREHLEDVIKYYQKLGIDSSDYQTKEQEKIEKYYKAYSMMQQEYQNAKRPVQETETKEIVTKQELLKELDCYETLIEKFENDLEDFSEMVQTYKEKAYTYTTKKIMNIKKKLQSSFQNHKLQLFGLDQKYHEILNRFQALELDTKEFELQNKNVMTPIKKKFTKVENDVVNFGENITQTEKKEDSKKSEKTESDKAEKKKELTKTQLYCKELTLKTLIKRSQADFLDFYLTLEFYKQKMVSCDEKKSEKIRKKLQSLYNEYQLQMIEVQQKYQEIYEEYGKTYICPKNELKIYQDEIHHVREHYEKINTMCAELNLESIENAPETVQTKEEKKKELANMKAYLLSLKALTPWALGGAAVGLGASVVLPNVAITGLGSIRIASSLVKFGNKIYSKKFLNGEATPIDNVVDMIKYRVEEKGNHFLGTNKAYRNIREGVRNINNFLKNPKVQSVITGLSIGYVAGNLMNLNDKVDRLLNHPQPQSNGGALTSKIHETLETGTNKVLEQNQMIDPPVKTPEIPSYEWIKTGKTIDLTGIQEGYTNVYDAMSNNNAVTLMNELASQENGTMIEQFVLPNGEKFFGNMDALIEKCEGLGVKLENVGALISNQNGYYGYTTGEEIIEHALEMSRSL